MKQTENQIIQAYSHLLSGKAGRLLSEESSKGCLAALHPQPVALEPPYRFFQSVRQTLEEREDLDIVYEPSPPASEFQRMEIWPSPRQPFDWIHPELFLKLLSSSRRRTVFDIAGNQKQIRLNWLCHREDLPIVHSAFRTHFPEGAMLPASDNYWDGLSDDSWKNFRLREFFPTPPYFHLLTQPSEFKLSPLLGFIQALAVLPETAWGVYQVVFQPTDRTHNWHHNVQVLHDLEFMLKLQGDALQPSRYGQQTPSGDMHDLSRELNQKAHNDKPFFTAAVRALLLDSAPQPQTVIESFSSMMNLFLHGGQALQILNESDYAAVLSLGRIREMWERGLTYRAGFLLNSWELSGLVHFPGGFPSQGRNLPLRFVEPIRPLSGALDRGTKIGRCLIAGVPQEICIPPAVRARHTHIIGKSGMGKSSTAENMILDDIEQNHGVAVLDPHGDLIEQILPQIPPEKIERVIYFDPGDPEWAVIWNPLTLPVGQEAGRVADDLVGAIKSLVTGWGDRLENILRYCFLAFLQRPGSTFLDINNILRPQAPVRNELIAEVQALVKTPVERLFWQEDFGKFTKDDVSPVKNKLSKLVTGNGSLNLTLSQRENRIHFREIMDKGYIFLADLSSLGSEVRNILGSFLLSLLHITALGRQNVAASQRKAFHIYCDEAHRFVTDALQDLIAETRKYGVSLTLAHQYLSQFNLSESDALSNVGCTLIFNVDAKDAHYLCKDLGGTVQTEDIISLEVGQAIARIGTETVRIRTYPPRKGCRSDTKQKILDFSHRAYYQRSETLREEINRQFPLDAPPARKPVNLPIQDSSENPEEFLYDEIE